ncbi:MAG: sigma-70 family RNA polymerase sigma factor [Bacteroidales bacterium]|nr:sigma-70 family RNA polymerase sigma factor [Bacteroidales bacterium]
MTRQEITQFYQEHHRRLYNISLRILRNSDEAEEVMQDTIMKFVSAPQRTFGSGAQVSAWLARTCIRASIDRLRKRHREEAFLEDYAMVEGDSPVEPANDERPSISRVRDTMDRMPEPYRLVLYLVLIEGLDYGEIAEMTGRKQTTLRSIYSRGLDKLRAMLRS